MCEKCVAAVQKYYPDLPEEDWSDLLWGATAFPMGSPEQIEEQLAEAKDNTDGTLEGALSYADKKMSEAMTTHREEGIDGSSYYIESE